MKKKTFKIIEYWFVYSKKFGAVQKSRRWKDQYATIDVAKNAILVTHPEAKELPNEENAYSVHGMLYPGKLMIK
jgi:hypothetical protein